MTKTLPILPRRLAGIINLPASKSISNRLLIMNAVEENHWEIRNLSTADDTVLMQSLLKKINQADITQETEIYCKNAGTVFRFLTAFLSVKPGLWRLTGDERLKQRPIFDLVAALKTLGADIEYLGSDQTPPLLIRGHAIVEHSVAVFGAKSSQFVSALMMLAPHIEKGLHINMEGEIISKPYISMTAKLLEEAGCTVAISEKDIIINGKIEKNKVFYVESDWTAASYFYALAALSEQADIVLKGLTDNSIQGDSILKMMFAEHFGVETTFEGHQAILRKTGQAKPFFEMDFTDYPDLAQTIAVLCVALNIDARLKGLNSLKDKETNRLHALETELRKLGAEVSALSDSLIIHSSKQLNFEPIIETYGDHRMAMAFSLFSAITNNVKIKNPEVVEKSYPNFFTCLNEISN